MYIPDSQNIRAWDKFTMENEPVSSISLMERAASAFAEEFMLKYPDRTVPVHIFCGNGNNGGDGLVAARLLMWAMYDVVIYKISLTKEDSADFVHQWHKTAATGNIPMYHWDPHKPTIPQSGIIIDAILGTGLTRPVEGDLAGLIAALNASQLPVVSIDIPSGMPADGIIQGEAIQATETLTFQTPKYSFFLPENAGCVPRYSVVDIGLHKDFVPDMASRRIFTTSDVAASMYKKRSRFAHKGTQGTVHLLAGSEEMTGACILSCEAALRSGAGLVKGFLPRKTFKNVAGEVPEVIFLRRRLLREVEWHNTKNFLAIGPGLGTGPKCRKWLEHLLSSCQKPIVLDADALNILSGIKNGLERIPPYSILTPHPGEFERLFGTTENSLGRYQLAQKASQKYGCIILLKGAYTHIFLPDGNIYINSTGNPGMATAGSGDVLTGIIAGLLAQQYSPKEATVLGAFIHGLSGDTALRYESEESLIASDLIKNLGKAWKTISAQDS